MVIGGVAGAAIYSRGLAYCIQDNIARYGQAINNVDAGRIPAGLPDQTGLFMSWMTEISIKQIYGWAAYACILLLLLFLLYDAPVRRKLKQIPAWQKIRNLMT